MPHLHGPDLPEMAYSAVAAGSLCDLLSFGTAAGVAVAGADRIWLVSQAAAAML